MPDDRTSSLADRRRLRTRPVDLPTEVRHVLRLISADMRRVPRAVLHPEELIGSRATFQSASGARKTYAV